MQPNPKTRDDRWLGTLVKGSLALWGHGLYEIDSIEKVGIGRYVRLRDPITKTLCGRDVCIVELREPPTAWTLLIVAGSHKEARYWLGKLRHSGFENPILYVRNTRDVFGRSPVSTRWVRIGTGKPTWAGLYRCYVVAEVVRQLLYTRQTVERGLSFHRLGAPSSVAVLARAPSVVDSDLSDGHQLLDVTARPVVDPFHLRRSVGFGVDAWGDHKGPPVRCHDVLVVAHVLLG